MKNLTQKQKDTYKLKILILKQAKERFSKGDCSGICRAISKVSEARWTDTIDAYTKEEAGEELRDYISKSLGQWQYLESWQSNNDIISSSVYNDRLDWIDWMVDCYEGYLLNDIL